MIIYVETIYFTSIAKYAYICKYVNLIASFAVLHGSEFSSFFGVICLFQFSDSFEESWVV